MALRAVGDIAMTHSPPAWQPPDEPADPRLDEVDQRIDDLLRVTAHREVPTGLSARVAQASTASLAHGRRTQTRRLVFSPVARLAVAAVMGLAVVGLFWLVDRGPDLPEVTVMTSVALLDQPESEGRNPFDRFRGLQMVESLQYSDAMDGLESVVSAIQSGAGSYLVLSEGERDRDAFENELDAVRVVARLGG